MTHWSNVGDATFFDTFGWNLASQGVLGVGHRPSAFVMPGYPFLIAAVYRVVGHHPGGVRWLQVVLGAATVLMLGAFTARIGGRRSGLIVAAAGAVYPYFLYFVPEILTEASFMFGFAGMLLTARLCGDTGRVRDGVLFGVFFAWAMMTRSIALVLAPGILVLARPWAAERRGPRLTGLVLGVALVAVLWGAWVARNERVVGAPVLLDTHGGFMMYTSQLISMGVPHDEVVRRARNDLGFYRYDIEKGTLPGGPSAELEADRRATAKAKELSRQDPAGRFARIPRNVGRLWLNLDFAEVSRTGRRLSLVALAGWASYLPVLLLACAGLWRLWRDRRVPELVALAWILAVTTVLFGLMAGGKRYRVATIDPVLICAAGLQTDALVRRWVASRRA